MVAAFFGVLALTISRPIAMLLCVLVGSACAANDSGAAFGGSGGASGFAGAGAFGGGAGSSTSLVVETAPAIAMLPTEQAEIVVRYLDDNGAPIGNADVSFTLVGSAQDSGLSRVMATTDGAGHATTTVLAGTSAASFQVRATAPGASPVAVDVAVSDRGFGNLRVTAPYAGLRPVTQRRVALFAGWTCDQLGGGASPDRQSNLAAHTDDAHFIGLPAETSYAVVAVGFGEPATALTQGCVDAVVITADVEVSVEVTFQDFDLSPWGDYDLTASLETSSVASDLVEHVRAHAMSGQPGSQTSPAQTLLAALDAVLRADPTVQARVTAASVLTQLREQGAADSDLQAAMDTELVGPAKAQEWVADQLVATLAAVELDLGVSVVEGADEPSIAWTLRRVTAMSGAELGGGIQHVVVDPTPIVTAPSFLWSRDQMTATAALPSVFGALAAKVIEGAMERAGRVSARDHLGCAELHAWVTGQDAIVSACDATCVNQACDEVLDAWLADLSTSLVGLDQSRSVVSLGGTFDLHDNSADTVVDVFETAMLSATWEADPSAMDATGSYMTGTASAVVSSPNPP